MSNRRPPVNPRNFLILTALLALWVVVVVVRLVQLQVIEYDQHVRQARRQQEQTVAVSPVRGNIYDRNMRPLAMSIEVESVFAVPNEIADPEATARLLSPVLEMKRTDLEKKFEGERSFRWVKRKVAARAAERVRQLNLKGIYFQKESKRFYPKRELAAHVLGYVGVDDQGLAGIELVYEKQIQGRPGQLLIERDARRRRFGRTGKPPEAGEDLVLTLDETIQYVAEQALDEVMKQSRARSGTVLVGDPHTGEILAMANRPTYNPNTYGESDPEVYRNLATGGVYEPGSTFKIVTVAAALEEKLTWVDELVDCQMGSISVAGHTIRDHRPFGILTVREAFGSSSDVCIIKLALRLGDAGLYDHLRRFGFGSKTGIELPGEESGLTKPPERWWKASIGAIAMGQEIGATPLQIMAAASAVANNGVWVRPTIIRGEYRRGREDPARLRRVMSPATAETMRRIMEHVVVHGTGMEALPKGYSAGGKTGTAQKLDPATGTYSVTDHVASFVGFTPAEDPIFTILVVLDSPRGLYHGGEVAAPVFRTIAEQLLVYRNVPGEDLESLPLRRASTTIRNRVPAEEQLWEQASTDESSYRAGLIVPNFLGEGVREVTARAVAGHLPVQLVGSGIAFEQSPLPGTPLPAGERIVVRFKVGSLESRKPAKPPEDSSGPAEETMLSDPVSPQAASG